MVCAIILAAGRSRRMNTQKLLLPFADGTVIGHIAGQVLRSPVGRTFVVVAQDAARIAAALAGLGLTLVTNPDSGGDMLSSVRCGLRALPADCQAVLVALGDQPSITSDLIGLMIRTFLAAGRGILVPIHGGRRGHPILFSARYRQEILTSYDEVGLRGLLQSHGDDLIELPVPNPSVLADMDYPEDYRREVGRVGLQPGDEPAA